HLHNNHEQTSQHQSGRRAAGPVPIPDATAAKRRILNHRVGGRRQPGRSRAAPLAARRRDSTVAVCKREHRHRGCAHDGHPHRIRAVAGRRLTMLPAAPVPVLVVRLAADGQPWRAPREADLALRMLNVALAYRPGDPGVPYSFAATPGRYLADLVETALTQGWRGPIF